jgi:pyruvate,water dikinase
MRSIHPLFERQKSILELSTADKGGTYLFLILYSPVSFSLFIQIKYIIVMHDWIVRLSTSNPAGQVGSKAAALGWLVEAGFPVPAGVCLTVDAFTAAADLPGDLRLPQGLLAALVEALPVDAPLVVRSSAVGEDLPEASQAGRYITRLNVQGASALERAVLDCWRSADATGGGMAVLIQPMVAAECAGVCFTVDPVRLRADLLLVVSAWGLGAGVVSGAIPSDTARLRRQDLTLQDATVADKHSALRTAAGGGIEQVDVAEDRRTIPCLPENWLQRIGQYGLAIEQLFGVPQDVEWAVADGQVWILQSRPVTALPAETRAAARFPIHWDSAEEPRHYWWRDHFWVQNSNDQSEAPLYPAQMDFVDNDTRGMHDSVYFAGLGGTRLRKKVNGRVYMTIVESPHPPGHVRVYSTAMSDLRERLAQQDIPMWEYWGPEVMRATGRLSVFDPRGADGNALADHLENAVATAQRHWMVHTMTGPRPMRSAVLRDAYVRLAGIAPEQAAKELPFLLAGNETIQTRLIEALYDLACLASVSPESAEAFARSYDSRSLAESAKQDSRNLGGFEQAFLRLMAVYGERLVYQEVPGYPVRLPLPWREASGAVWQMIAAYLPQVQQGNKIPVGGQVSPKDQTREGNPYGSASQNPCVDPREIRLAAWRAGDARVEKACSVALRDGASPAQIEDFRQTLDFSRRNAVYLDEHNHYIDQLSEGQYVQALMYAGRWLAARGCLPGPFDVFWLHVDELLGLLRQPAGVWAGVLSKRRAEMNEFLELIPPACLGLPDPRLPGRPIQTSHQVKVVSVDDMPEAALRGEPASRGRASGRARLMRGSLPPADIASGDVLVASAAGPDLIPFLPAMKAVVLDYGGPGDHFAITAREFGIPVVCATLQATQNIPEGAWVSVDADEGLVRWSGGKEDK